MAQGGGNRGGHGGKGGKGGKGGGKSGGQAKALAQLLQPRKSAKGKDLLKLARALTKLEIKPEVKSYQRLAKELRGQSAADTLGMRRLGQDVSEHIGGAYRGFDRGAQQGVANAAAVGAVLDQQVRGLGQQAAQEQQTAQTGQLGGLQEAMALRGAPGGGQAQAALQNLVGQQAARRAQESQAAGTAAAAQGGNYTGLANAMRTATAAQGTTALSDTQRTIAARIAENKLASSADIREAMGKKADVKALRGETMLKNLGEARETERDWILGRAATRQDKAELASSNRQAALDRQADAKQADADRAADIADREDEQRHDIRVEHEGDKGEPSSDSGGSGDRQERRQTKKAINLAARAVGQSDSVEHHQQYFAAFVQEIMANADVNGALARQLAERAARRWIKRHGG